MKTIKNLDVQDIQQQIESTKKFINQTKESVEQVKQALNGVTTLHEGFEGNTADSIRSFFEETHKPFLEFMESFLVQYEEALGTVNEQVLSFEPNESGFIRQEFLEDELTNKIQKAQDSLSATTNMINQQLNSVSDLASVSHVKDDTFLDSVAEAKKRINKTVDNMYEMDSNATSKLDKSEDDMQQLKTYVSKLKSAIDKNNITVDNFNVSQFNSVFSSYHNEFKMLARGRNALATGEKAEITQDEFNSLFPFVKTTESVMDYYNEWNGSYHTLKDGRIIREYPTQDGSRFEFVGKIPNPRASQPSDDTNIVMDILGPAWKDTVNYFTEDFVTLFDSKSSWWERGLAAAFIVPWGKGIKSEFKFGVKKGLDDIRTILNSKAPKSKRFKAGLSLLTPPNPGQQAFQFGEKYIKPVLLKNGGFLAKKVDRGKRLSSKKLRKSNFDDVVRDGKKSSKHSEVKNKNSLPGKGEPNSSKDLLNPDGTVKQRRYYDENGRAKEDIDFNHSDDGSHTFPHRHKWDWSKKPPRQKPE
ncbi:LXG domain-containing protein [Virgibacillus sp. 7505]|uniref:ribonuclease YeeF family protein n=1 Tax=Virgibacillus sp. 7505 TaxID=2022548 RepID=UPI0015955F20|nr:LXG domain-containing protein [Virgibacillus sp. 7505]